VKTVITIILMFLLLSLPAWATGSEGSTPPPETTQDNNSEYQQTFSSSAGNTEYICQKGNRGDPGPVGPQGPGPSDDQVMTCIKRIEELKEEGYKIPKSYGALIQKSKDRKIIVGFATANGIEWKWGRDVQRSEMAQFVGRLLKVIDKLEAKMTQRDDKLRKELIDLRTDLTTKLASLEGRVDQLEEQGVNGEKILAFCTLGVICFVLMMIIQFMLSRKKRQGGK